MPAKILSAKVRHQRLFPRDNTFDYGLYYLALPLSQLENVTALPVNRKGLLSFQTKDHGPRDGTDLRVWLDSVLKSQGMTYPIDEVVLLAMPRTLGYGFNPVSFWLCLDAQGDLRAVLCEVNNTFGETHCYVCFHADMRPITDGDWLTAQKCFHVSPFLPRTGSYFFRFHYASEALSIWIHYHDEHGRPKLITALRGDLAPLTPAKLRKALWAHPWVGVKTMGLIHWQALKLWLKRIQFYTKPEQLTPRVTQTHAGYNDSELAQRAVSSGERILASVKEKSVTFSSSRSREN